MYLSVTLGSFHLFVFSKLGLWELAPKSAPRNAKLQPLSTESHIDYSDSQVPLSDNGFYVDPKYPADLSV